MVSVIRRSECQPTWKCICRLGWLFGGEGASFGCSSSEDNEAGGGEEGVVEGAWCTVGGGVRGVEYRCDSGTRGSSVIEADGHPLEYPDLELVIPGRCIVRIPAECRDGVDANISAVPRWANGWRP